MMGIQRLDRPIQLFATSALMPDISASRKILTI